MSGKKLPDLNRGLPKKTKQKDRSDRTFFDYKILSTFYFYLRFHFEKWIFIIFYFLRWLLPLKDWIIVGDKKINKKNWINLFDNFINGFFVLFQISLHTFFQSYSVFSCAKKQVLNVQDKTSAEKTKVLYKLHFKLTWILPAKWDQYFF